MFQKNLKALKQNNPELADRIEKIDMKSITNISVLNSESKNLIISYNGVNLHSSVDPLKEANAVWERSVKSDLGKNDIQVLFGMGLGYLFKRAYVNAKSKIFILEQFIEILRFTLEYVDFSNELADSRVFITDNVDEMLAKIEAEFLSGDRIEFLFIDSYAALSINTLTKLTQKTLEICESKTADQNTIFFNCKLWTKNFILNMSKFNNSRPVCELRDLFKNKPALIVSAGPSLAQNIENIKKNKDKFIIIAVVPAFKILIQAGIIPDFVTFADPNYLDCLIKGYEKYLSTTNMVLKPELKARFLAEKQSID